jgi:hypothetical protein
MSSILQSWLMQLFDWLACADEVCNGDIIFALAGRQSRKIFALELFSQRRAPGLILSVGRFEIRRFADLHWPAPLDLMKIAAPVSPPQRHFFASYWNGESAVELVRRHKFGTLSEIEALAAWLKRHPEINFLLVVSSGPHLRRVQLCCRILLSSSVQVRYLGAVEDSCISRNSWWKKKDTRAMVLYEFPKLLLYAAVLQLQKVSHAMRLAGDRVIV